MDKLLKALEKDYIGKSDCKLRHYLEQHSIPEIVSRLIKWLSIDWKDSDSLNYAEITTIARDFYIGSNLTPEEKAAYYAELQQQRFFETLSTFLYAKELSVCSWTIYTFGKFSKNENAKYLERAYEQFYSTTNPILASRCLSELHWLDSEKVATYIAYLHKNLDIFSGFILLLYWDTCSENEKIENLLTNQELRNFISPQNEKANPNEIIERLNHFERFIFKIHHENRTLPITKSNFLKTAQAYFESSRTDLTL